MSITIKCNSTAFIKYFTEVPFLCVDILLGPESGPYYSGTKPIHFPITGGGLLHYTDAVLASSLLEVKDQRFDGVQS